MAAAVGDLTRIEEQLAELWREQGEPEGGVTRACKMNLVLVTGAGDEERTAATRLVAALSATEPGRAILVSPSLDTDHPIRGYVSAHCHRGADGRRVCSEQITLEVREDAFDRVPPTVLQLLVEEMPTCTLWRRPGLEPRKVLDALCGISDRLVVDGSTLSSPLNELAELMLRPRPRVDDLSWARIEPWREAVASLFDLPALRGRLEDITRVKVVADGRIGATYLAAWLASRLGWRERVGGAWERPDGGDVAIDIVCEGAEAAGQLRSVELDVRGERATTCLKVERVGESADVVRLRVEQAESCPSPYCLKLPVRDDGAVLAGLLQREEDDPVFRATLSQAARFRKRR